MMRAASLRVTSWVLCSAVALAACSGEARQAVAPSERPDTPFKLATFEAGGQVRLGLVLGARVLDIAGANQHLVAQTRVATVEVPTEMRALIEAYPRVSARLYQIANYFAANPPANLPFAFDANAVAYKAPIKYPWNLLAAAANYKSHAQEMNRPAGGGFQAVDVLRVLGLAAFAVAMWRLAVRQMTRRLVD